MARPPAGVLDLFEHAPKRDRLHVRGRVKSCPIDAIDAVVPRCGRVLEVGCGHGLVAAWLAVAAPERRVHGIDIDKRKIALAAHAASRAPAELKLSFEARDDGTIPAGPWDAIVVVDVLYLLDRDAERALIAACVDQLAPQGLLVLKETDVVPRYKHRLAQVQELVATKVLRITKGTTVSFTPVSELCDYLRSLGLDVSIQRVDRGYLHPHVQILAKR